MTPEMAEVSPLFHQHNRAVNELFHVRLRACALSISRAVLANAAAPGVEQAFALRLLRDSSVIPLVAEYLATDQSIAAVEPSEPVPGNGWQYDVPDDVLITAVESNWPALAAAFASA